MKILVTGGAGFIGSALCKRLSEEHEVWSLDDYSSGCKSKHHARVSYIDGSTSEISEIPELANVDTVFHLGEYARVERSFIDRRRVWESNQAGTFEVIEFCQKVGAKLIYAGSSTKFGDDGLGRSQSPYSWSKASNTDLVCNYGNWFGLKYAITYFYNVYGPGEIEEGPYATLIGLYSALYRGGQSLPVVLPGTQRRNFTHINDIVDALVLVGMYGEGDEYGIGCFDSFSVIEVAEMFGSDIEFLPERQGNRMSADLVLEKTLALGWRPKHHLHDYIRAITCLEP